MRLTRISLDTVTYVASVQTHSCQVKSIASTPTQAQSASSPPTLTNLMESHSAETAGLLICMGVIDSTDAKFTDS